MTEPALTRLDAAGPTRAVVLVLHGGQERSREPTTARQLAVLRMVPIARGVHRRVRRSGGAVWLLRNTVRGWNEPDASPLADARWALARVRAEHGDVPVVLVGHSMGGRTALRLLGEPSVVGAVALAPWLPERDPVAQANGKAVLIAHGNADVVTSPSLSRLWAERARRAGAEVTYEVVCGDIHAMLLRWRRWQALTERFVLRCLRSAGALSG